MTISDSVVFAGLSGGVDSAVAATMLYDQGARLVGVSHIVWPESKCCSTACLDHCQAFCDQLGVPYYRVDCIVPFCRQVIDPFIQAYEQALTPNPCVLCNQKIRFDLMIDLLFSEHPELLTDNYMIMTGHYARIGYLEGMPILMRGRDLSKDQSYMLYRLGQAQLKRVIFPLGDFLKSETRAFASQRGLFAAAKPDSQDACFVQDQYQTFISQYTGNRYLPGNFVDFNGTVLGTHQGIPFYTRGQRRGLNLSGGPWFVIEIQPDTNTIVLGRQADLLTDRFLVRNLVRHPQFTAASFKAFVQTRYHSMIIPAHIRLIDADQAVVRLDQASGDVSPGQSAVFYLDDMVIGGGIISSSRP